MTMTMLMLMKEVMMITVECLPDYHDDNNAIDDHFYHHDILNKPDEVAVSILEFADSGVTGARRSCRCALARSPNLLMLIVTTKMRRMKTMAKMNKYEDDDDGNEDDDN